MTIHENKSNGPGDVNVAELLDNLAQRLQAGEQFDLKEYVRSHCEHAEELLELLPVIRAMAEFGQSADDGDASAGMLGSESGRAEAALRGTLGDFRIIGTIGRGGMGVVYLAEQLSLRRRVALKVLPFATLLDARQLKRFKNEAQAAATLEHPHIVPVYAVGCDRGVHYYAMRFIDGLSLAEVIADMRNENMGLRNADSKLSSEAAVASDEVAHTPNSNSVTATREIERKKNQAERPHECPHLDRLRSRLDTTPVGALSTQHSRDRRAYHQTVARLGIQAAEALAHSHQLGIIHRDIKPSNLLVDHSGHLWVTDFGLALTRTDTSTLTRTGDMLGTLRYMSPEQSSGQHGVLDHRADIYSLGATLYELLTLRPAFPSEDRQKLLRQISTTEPPPPRQLVDSVSVDLQTIILKAMAKEPNDRYSTALDLADDLQRFLDRRPIQARPLGRIARAYRWCRRSPAFAGAMTAIVVLSLCVALLSVLFAARESTHRHQAEARTEEAEWQQYVSDMHSAMAAWEQSNIGRTLELLKRHRPGPGEPDLRGFEWNYLWRQCQDKRLLLTINETSFVRGVAVSHDERMVATGNDEGLVRIWDSANGWLKHEIKTPAIIITRVAFSPDDRLLASGEGDGSIHLWDLADSRLLRTMTGHTANIVGLLFSPDGKQLASGSLDADIRIWDVDTGRELRKFRPEARQPVATFLIPPWIDHRLWEYEWNGKLRLLDTHTGQELRCIDRQELYDIQSVARVSWDGRIAATAGIDGVVRLLETESGQELAALGSHWAAVRALAFAPDDKTLASSDNNGKVIVWDMANRVPRTMLRGHSGQVWRLEFLNNGQRLCTSGTDRRLHIWDINPQASPMDVCRGHDGLALCVAFSPDGRTIASGGTDPNGGRVALWDVATGQLKYRVEGHTGWVWSVAFSPDGKELATTGEDGTLRLWDVSGFKLIKKIPTGKESHWLSYSRDGEKVITSEVGGTLRVLDRSTGVRAAGGLVTASVVITTSRWFQLGSPRSRI